MATDVKVQDALDLQPRKAVGVKLPFSSTSVFTSTFQTKDAIKTNLINFFLTGKGKSVLNPTFGSDIKRFIFDPINANTSIVMKNLITKELEVYFPRVEPIDINVTQVEDRNTIQFSVQYTIKQSNIEDEVTINFEQ